MSFAQPALPLQEPAATPRSAIWHERLKLFLLLEGPVRFRMGEQEVELACGDLLAVDNSKPHQVLDFPGFATCAAAISFTPEFVSCLLRKR